MKRAKVAAAAAAARWSFMQLFAVCVATRSADKQPTHTPSRRTLHAGLPLHCGQQLQGRSVVLTRYVSCTAGSNCDSCTLVDASAKFAASGR